MHLRATSQTPLDYSDILGSDSGSRLCASTERNKIQPDAPDNHGAE